MKKDDPAAIDKHETRLGHDESGKKAHGSI
jgi:hypothetical protein